MAWRPCTFSEVGWAWRWTEKITSSNNICQRSFWKKRKLASLTSMLLWGVDGRASAFQSPKSVLFVCKKKPKLQKFYWFYLENWLCVGFFFTKLQNKNYLLTILKGSACTSQKQFSFRPWLIYRLLRNMLCKALLK